MTQANRQTTAQSTAHFGAKATGKLTGQNRPTAKPEPVKTRPISRAEIDGDLLRKAEKKDQPVLDYLKDK